MKTKNVYSSHPGHWFVTGKSTNGHGLFRWPAGILPFFLTALALLPLIVLGQSYYSTPYTFTTIAGNSGYGNADGTNSAAQFAFPSSVAVDANGNIFVADTVNSTIREVTPVGNNWVVTTLAGLAGCTGTNDGTGYAARFAYPNGMALDNAGNLYVADTGNDTIREVTQVGTNWVVTTLVGLPGTAGTNDGTGNAVRFNGPGGVAVDSAGNVYVSDTGNHTIRSMTPAGSNWVVTTIIGLPGVTGSANGIGSAARFFFPFGLTVATNGSLYVADYANDAIRKVTPVGVNWSVTTLATGFNGPYGVAVDNANYVYVTATANHAISKVAPSGGVTTLAGSVGNSGTNNGTGGAARFAYPCGVVLDSAGNLFVADSGNSTIRKVTPMGLVTTLAGLAESLGSTDGAGSATQFHFPFRMAVDTNGIVYVTDEVNNTIRKITPVGANWVVTTIAGLAGSAGANDGTGSAARFNGPCGVALDSTGNLYVTDGINNTIRKLTPVGSDWIVTTIAGSPGASGAVNGTNKAARFNLPVSLTVDSGGNLYVADFNNNIIREVTPVGTNWVVTTIATGFNGPEGVALDNAGNLYVADLFNFTIRKVTPVGSNWVVTTLAGLARSPGYNDGTNSTARFGWPQDVAVDSAGNIYESDQGINAIRKLTPVGTNWVVTTLAGRPGYIGEIDGTGSNARFNEQTGLALDNAGNLYVADSGHNTIRKGFPASSVTSPMLQPPSLSAAQFGFGITGMPKLAVNIEASSDLATWQVVGTCCLAGGTNYFFDPNPGLGAQFYRSHVR